MNILTDYRNNPFRILGALPRQTRAELNELKEEAMLFGGEEIEKALADLLHPASRLAAELYWFPQTSAETISDIDAFISRAAKATPFPTLNTPSALAIFNTVRYMLATVPLKDENRVLSLIYSMAIAADGLIAEEVIAELNADREASGFPLLEDLMEIKHLLMTLQRETAVFFFSSIKQENLKTCCSIWKEQSKKRDSRYHCRMAP